MTRRQLLAGAAATVLAPSGRAQLQPAIDYPQYARCLPDFLRALAKEACERRDRDIAKITTADAVRRRQQWARDTLWKLIGGRLERTPLQQRTTGSFERAKYRVEKLVYASRPGLLVSANLYLPKEGKPPYPGILFQMGHSGNGKAAESYQFCCQGLAQLGYVVLAFDPMGQGERVNYPGPTGMTRLPSSDDEHTTPGRQMLLVGDTATRMQVWDAIRSLDVLAAHPMVDPKRLGSTGQSGGGTLTMLLAAADERLAAAVVNSGNTENFACPGFIPPGSTDDAEQDLIGSGPAGFDRWDLLWPMAPKPLLVITSAKDFFGTYSPNYVRNGRAEFARLRGAYAKLGAGEQVQYRESPLPHGLSYAQRVATYDFFERKLKRGGKVTAEPPVAAERDEELWAAPKGNVRNLGSKTPWELTRAAAAEIRTPDAVPHDLGARLQVQRSAGVSRVRGKVASSGCEILAVDVESEPGVLAPSWVFVPKKAPRCTLILLDAGGRNRDWREGGLCHRLAADGIRVYAADVRGIGDLTPEFGAGSPGYQRDHQSEENYAWASLMLGRPLLGQRVTDILAIVNSTGGDVYLAARGRLNVATLCAAVMGARVRGVYLTDGPVSWRQVVDTENYKEPLSNFVFDILRHTDIPQISAKVKPEIGPWTFEALRQFCV